MSDIWILNVKQPGLQPIKIYLINFQNLVESSGLIWINFGSQERLQKLHNWSVVCVYLLQTEAKSEWDDDAETV